MKLACGRTLSSVVTSSRTNTACSPVPWTHSMKVRPPASWLQFQGLWAGAVELDGIVDDIAVVSNKIAHSLPERKNS